MNINKLKGLLIAVCCCLGMSFLWVMNSAIGMESCVPGVEEWKDSSGKPAPARVRKAADNLWKAVEVEGSAAFDDGWCTAKEPSWGIIRCLSCVITCGINECGNIYDEAGTFSQKQYSTFPGAGSVYTQRTKEMKTALDEFKEAVNGSVVKPEHYSGDTNICELGPWVEDGVRSRNNWAFSGRRDLRNVPSSTLEFVNAHGGWSKSEYGSISY